MNDWRDKLLLAFIPIIAASVGWLVTLNSRVERIDTLQQERIRWQNVVEAQHADLDRKIERILSNPEPTPPAKIFLDQHERRLEKLESRVNGLHEYLIQLPIRPPPYAPNKRGDLGPLPKFP
jgi:hypothetical protein